MSNKINESKEFAKIKEEILAQMRLEQKKFAQNLEDRMDETNQLINDLNTKFLENKDFFENVLSQKYYTQKLENLDKNSTKINDSLLAHEIRISKNIDEINSLRTKYDKIILDNLLIPGQIGPSCQYKNLSQYLKNNIYDMTRMKADNENMKNLSNEIRVKFETGTKNITGLIDNSVTRSNQYTDSRINDCISVLDNKTKQMNEKIMEMRMKMIQKQSILEENINLFKDNYEEQLRIQNEKIKNLNSIINQINEDLPDEEIIYKNIDKLKHKLKSTKNLLLSFIANYQPPAENQQPQGKNRRNSVMGLEFSDLINSNLEALLPSPRKNGKNDSKINESSTGKNNKGRESLSPVRRQRQTINVSSKFQSNQKTNVKLKLINISETSSDSNDNDEKFANIKEKYKSKYKNKQNENETNNDINYIKDTKETNERKKRESKYNFNESKKNKNKSSRNNKLDKENKSKGNNKNKNNKSVSKNIQKDFSNANSFDSISDSNYSDSYQEMDKVMEIKPKQKYLNKKNIEKIMIQSKTINPKEKHVFHISNTSNNSVNHFPNINIENNNFSNSKLKSTYQSFSRNINNNTNTISSNQYSNNANTQIQQSNFYRTQQEEKKEIIKDFFSKYDKKAIPENLSLIKNRANLDLYNYSVSPPDNKHFLDTKQDEIYDPPLSKEFLFNKKNNPNDKSYSGSKLKNLTKKFNANIKINLGNSVETSNKKVGTINNDKKMFLGSNNNNDNNKFIRNKKMEFTNKFTNTYRNYFPENIKKEKMYNMMMNTSKKG